MFFTATQGARLVVGALLLWVISKTDKAGIHLFKKIKPSTLLTDGELLKFFTVTCCVINCISSIPERTGIILFFVLVCSSSKTCSSLSTFPPIKYFQITFVLVGAQLIEPPFLSLVPKPS